MAERFVNSREIIDLITEYPTEDGFLTTDTEDLYDFERKDIIIDEEFCRKDYDGVQRYFFCRVCSSELRGLAPFTSHLAGKMHSRKVRRFERTKQGLNSYPTTTTTTRTHKEGLKKPTLESLLRENPNYPVLGLNYILEIEPGKSYECFLCDNAWGDSRDMFYHLTGNTMKHSKKFLALEDKDIERKTRNKILDEALKYFHHHDGGKHDYEKIKRIPPPPKISLL